MASATSPTTSAWRRRRWTTPAVVPGAESFSASTKNDVSWPFLKELRDLGRIDAKEWLEANFDKIGVESTLDMDKTLRRDPVKPPTRGAPATTR